MDKNILFHMRNKHVYLQKHNKHDKIYKWYLPVYLWYGITTTNIDF